MNHSNESPAASEALLPFPLLLLPEELLLLVVKQTDERRQIDVFPAGPSSELLALSATSRYFRANCAPLIWHTVAYEPAAGPRPESFSERRGMAALLAICRARQEGGHPLPIRMLSLSREVGGIDGSEDAKPEEDVGLVGLVQVLGRAGLQVLFLQNLDLGVIIAAELVYAICKAPALSALRMNRVDLGKLPDLPTWPHMSHLKTLQIMHGGSSLLELARKCPNVESLLLWPERRRIGALAEVISQKLPTLRLLSLDVVEEPACIMTIAAEIRRLTAAGSIPLTELFLEGPQTPSDRRTLIAALSKTSVKRLALYHLRRAKPELIEDIAAALPDLEALTLVQGGTEEPVIWPAPLEAYIAELSKLKRLQFFAFDRLSPVDFSTTARNERRSLQARAEYLSLGKIALACPSLQVAVAITLDVSEGANGWFAAFEWIGGKLHCDLKERRRVKDFLISFERWVRC